LKHIAPDKRNTILIVGFMAEHTLGRRVEEKAETIRLFGEEYPLRAEVCSISGFSSHADRDELSGFLGHLARPPARTFLVHGEEDQSLPLAEHLRRQGFPTVDVPASGDAFTI
jgi:metallo-beta-lactamase family protein